MYVATDDPHLPYVLRPGLDTTLRGIPTRINELGLRGPAVARSPAPGVHRILALGDSATFGAGLPVEEAFPAVLERELRARSGAGWEVLNTGVEGYNTEAELAYLRTRGLALHPETVVVGFNLNDYDYAPVIGPLGVLTLDPSARVSTWSPANVSEFYLVLRWLLITHGEFWGRQAINGPPRTPAPGTPFADLDRAISAMRKRYYEHPSDGRWQTMVDSLHGLGNVARANHVRLVIAIIPDGDQFDDPAPPLVHASFAASGGRGLHFDTMHPNAAGQAIIARVLAEHVLGAGLAARE
jgi:lysophospholipase L1-like esterase